MPPGAYRIAGVVGAEVGFGRSPLINTDPNEDSASADGSNAYTLYKRYRELVDRVTDAFGDEIVASQWLSTPSVDFNSRPPIEVAERSGYDVAVLEPVLIRIEHGVDF